MNNQDMDLKTERALRLESDSRFVSALISRMVDDVKKIYGHRAYLYISHDGQLAVGYAKHRFTQLLENVKTAFKKAPSVTGIIQPELVQFRSPISNDGLAFIANPHIGKTAYDFTVPKKNNMDTGLTSNQL